MWIRLQIPQVEKAVTGGKICLNQDGEMNENEFWKLIEASRRVSIGNASHQLDWLQVELEKRPQQEILDFDRLLREQMARSYSWDLWAAAYIINGGCSDDGFDYFRAWLTAQGKEIFHNAVRDPETLADVAETDSSLEELMYVAAKAYEVKTNTKFPQTSHPFPKLTGDKFDEDDEFLRGKYPKLFAKFRTSRTRRWTNSRRRIVAERQWPGTRISLSLKLSMVGQSSS